MFWTIIYFLPGEVAGFIKWRIVFAILGCFGMAIIYGLKINLSIAIVAMVNQSAIKAAHHDVHGPNLSHVGMVCHSEHVEDKHKNEVTMILLNKL